MSAVLPLLAVGAIGATALVLMVGVITFALGPGFSARHGTRLMAMRVALQGIAVAIVALMVLF